jgi:diacylglycerol kinase (ATP)
MKNRIASFKYALNGIRLMFKSGPNFIIQVLIAIIIICAGFYFKINSHDWTIILICIGGVLAAELFNTAIEKMVDHLSPEKNKYAGEIKDLAAGAVLLFAITTAIIGIIVFYPYVMH